MGKQAYLLRLALGRSAYEHPEDGPLYTSTRLTNGTASPSPPAPAHGKFEQDEPPEEVQLFNARGHPFNPWARSRSRRTREAMNDILSAVGVVRRSLPEALQELDGSASNHVHSASEDENSLGEMIGWAADIDNQLGSWWIHAFTNRLLVFPPSTESSFVDVICSQYQAMGFFPFFFGGLPAFLLSSLAHPEPLTYHAIYYIDRAVYANLIPKWRRDHYVRLRPWLARSMEVMITLFVLPFRLHSMLQLLGMIPASQWLPSPRSWIPFCGTSVFRLQQDMLPIFSFMAYRQISSITHDFLYVSSRPAVMEPTHPAQRRRSSGSRFAASVNSVHLRELPNIETPLTGLFRRLFLLLGWGQTRYSCSAPLHPDAVDLDRPWHVSANGPLDGYQPTQDYPRRHSSSAQPAPEETQSQNPTQPQNDEIEVQEDTEQHFNRNIIPTNNNDTTIRISSIDPESGTVNLEIGLPMPLEERASFRNYELEARQRHNRIRDGLATPVDLEWMRQHDRRRSFSNIHRKHHRVSRLALEPADMLASLVNTWVSGWVLIPVRAFFLGKLVKHVLSRPSLYSVSMSHETANWLTSEMWPQSIRGYTGKIALCCAVDVCLGLTFWVGEWMVVRSVGMEYFNWGRL